MIGATRTSDWFGLDEISEAQLSVNAYDDDEGPVRGRLAKDPTDWILNPPSRVVVADLALPPMPDLSAWKSEKVGWGVVMVEGAEVPQPVADLVAARHARIFRYQPNSRDSLTTLRDPVGGTAVDMRGAAAGMGTGHLPQYLMIVGSPREVPWGIQFILSAQRFVGRLDLDSAGLENYVNALLNDFKDAGTSDAGKVVVWSSGRKGDGDEITGLMRNLVAKALHERVAGDRDRRVYPTGVDVDGAPVKQLVQQLMEQRPGLIVTTSHGYTPIHTKGSVLQDGLGLPVDEDGVVLTQGESLDGWQPGGAVWYAHACCSAGSDAPTLYDGLFDRGSGLDQLVKGIAKAGPMTAPLPRRLLGHSRPLRAFIGHVEPTFDYMLRQPFTKVSITEGLIDSLYPNVFRYPVGRAFSDWIRSGSAARIQFTQHKRLLDRFKATLSHLLYYQLLATDTQATVVLGDPAALLPNVDLA
jgi:hypothetical protein